ncbi:DUF262 domain-containing protein [Pseudomonas sp. zfem002]|uniref:DUF262 domain-containing protein n=1 Tax=Pseudomonas sp. zfem002 TaxID=3078197 RepID=UPI00292A01AB|nr:DUF262 domain-containing protein [Pseudomonas sp. zfem002]MDU9392027.1 DUF262 domain-containing protein [Pseudomonas sp. zfem002]
MQLLALPDIFSGHFFTIPDYQRGYSWDKRQVEELLKDIDHLVRDRSTLRHYTGTLVLSRPEGSTEEFNVVDGQQRLTTLVIVLQQLGKRLQPAERAAFMERYLRRGGLGNERYVLRLNADTRTFFERVVLEEGNTQKCPATLEAHQRLLAARELVAAWLDARQLDGIPLDTLRQVVEKRLGFLVYAPDEDAETGIMFEVINNRGKALSELEKVKNYLIYCSVKLSARSLRQDIDRDWSAILQALNAAGKTSSGDEGGFLRYCMVVHFKLNKTDSQYGYDELKKRIDLDQVSGSQASRELAIERIKAFVDFMQAAALWYQRLYAPDHREVDASLVETLDQIRAQGRHASIMPLFLALVIKLDGKGERLSKLLRLLEILNFRVYMARGIMARNDRGQGDLYRLAAQYYHGALLDQIDESERRIGKATVEDDEDALELLLVRFVHLHASESRFRASFLLDADSPDDFYRWPGLRYFLMSYEARLQPKKTIQIDKILLGVQERKTADYLSVEHLWATENRAAPGMNDRAQDWYQRRRLGNFALLELRLNIQGCNADLESKLPRYLFGAGEEPPTDLQQVRKMGRDASEVLQSLEKRRRTLNYYLELHDALNNRQEHRYIEFALSRWSLKGYLGNLRALRESREVAEEEY